MPKKIKIEGKRIYVYEKCPTCSGSLEPNTNDKGFVVDFWCSKCGVPFTLEDLEMQEVELQKTMEEFI